MPNDLKQILQELPGTNKVSQIRLKDKIIKHIVFESSNSGALVLKSLRRKDSAELFRFYFKGLSEKSRIFFCPYPIFSPRPKNPKELSKTIKDWKKESDWTVLNLWKDQQIIGICLLKRWQTKKPTSGLAVHEKFQKKGLGLLLQTVINEQAKLLKLKKLVITLAQDNIASLKTHQKAGYKKTRKLVPHYTYQNGIKIIDRYDIEMIKKFS